MELLYKINWILVGFIAGLFWGAFAILFSVRYQDYLRPDNDSKKTGNLIRLGFILVFQFLYNAAFAFAGGIGLLIFFDRLKRGFFGLPELLLLLISLIALFGKLSDLIYKIPGTLKEIFPPKFTGNRETGK